MQSVNIVVPLNESPQASVALPVARTLASLYHGMVHLLRIDEPDELPDHERAALEQVGLRAYVVERRAGDPAAAIALASGREQSFLVMCAQTDAPGASGFVGPTTERVLHAARCPVVLVQANRGMASWAPREILVPHDGSPARAPAVSRAADLAVRAGARTTILHVVAAEAPRVREPGALGPPQYIDQEHHEWVAWAREWIERACAAHPPPRGPARMALASGRPGAAIVGVARQSGVDLIVLAWRGDLRHATTVGETIRDAPCPVMVVRAASGMRPS
jgi:nucleotide-binding universal stress UspA family protein